jgi:hypothetical protein
MKTKQQTGARRPAITKEEAQTAAKAALTPDATDWREIAAREQAARRDACAADIGEALKRHDCEIGCSSRSRRAASERPASASSRSRTSPKQD